MSSSQWCEFNDWWDFTLDYLLWLEYYVDWWNLYCNGVYLCNTGSVPSNWTLITNKEGEICYKYKKREDYNYYNFLPLTENQINEIRTHASDLLTSIGSFNKKTVDKILDNEELLQPS